jgi:hypothetical protein
MRDLDDAEWVGRPATTLTHIPPKNDPDDSTAILASAVTTPAAQRLADALLWEHDPGHTPRQLLTHCGYYLRGMASRTGALTALQREDYAAAAYLLGRQDGADEGDADADGKGLRAFLSGFFCCLALVILGLALISLRAL